MLNRLAVLTICALTACTAGAIAEVSERDKLEEEFGKYRL